MTENEPDLFDGTEGELHRRDLSRAFLEYLRPAARLRLEYWQALQKLAEISQAEHHPAEDDLLQDLDEELEALGQRCPDPLLIEGELTESDAANILENQGAFKKKTFEVDKELVLALDEISRHSQEHPETLIPHEQVMAEMDALLEEEKRTVDDRSYKDRDNALAAMRWSGSLGPVFEAYWNEPRAFIFFSIGHSQQFTATGLEVAAYSGPKNAAKHILGVSDFAAAFKVLHSESKLVTVEVIQP